MGIGSASYGKLLDEINAIEMIDIHSHIDPTRPAAMNPGEILLYHYIVTELRSAGVPASILSEDRDPKVRVKEAMPYLRSISNTTTYWCLMRILRDVYGFEGGFGHGDEDSYPRLLEGIMEGTGHGERAGIILRKMGRIRRTFLTFDCAREPPSYDPSLFTGALRIEPLIGRLSRSSLEGLSRVTGANVEGVDDFEEALALLFGKFRGCAAVTASFLPGEIFTKPEKERAETALGGLLSGSSPAPEERRALTSYALRAVLREVEGKGVPFQMMVGVERPIIGASPPDYALVALEPRMLISYCQLFHEFGDVNFDVFLANRIQSHELAVIAKNYPNVYVSGYWWYNLYPTIIREILRERVQMLPARKANGFFSDAYVAEWSYGKACLIRSQIAHVLAEMVDDGFYSMETAKELAEDLMVRNPARLYRLER